MPAAVAYKVRCPACGKNQQVDAAHLGRQVWCRACGLRIDLPAGPLLPPADDAATAADGSQVVQLTAALASPAAGTSTVPSTATMARFDPFASREPEAGRALPLRDDDRGEDDCTVWRMGERVGTAGVPTRLRDADAPTPDLLRFDDDASTGGGEAAAAPWMVFPSAAPAATPPSTLLGGVASGRAVAKASPAQGFASTAAAAPAAIPTLLDRSEQAVPHIPPSTIAPSVTVGSPGGPPAPPMPRAYPMPTAAGVGRTGGGVGGAPLVVRPTAAIAEAVPLGPPPLRSVPAAVATDGPGMMAVRPGGSHGTGTVDVAAVLAARARSRHARDNDASAEARRKRLWLLGAGVAAAVVVLLAAVFAASSSWFAPPWEAQYGPRVLALKAEAESLAGRGAFRESHDRYRKLDEMVNGREIRDPSLSRAVDDARADARRVYDLAIKSAPGGGSASGPGPVAPPVAAVPSIQNPPGPSSPVAPPSSPAAPPSSPAGSLPDAVASGGVPRVDPGREAVSSSSAPPTRPVADAGPKVIHRPVPRPAPVDPAAGVTDDQIGKAIAGGVDYLLGKFDAKAGVLSNVQQDDAAYYVGINALAVYALLASGQATDDPRLNHRGAAMAQRLDVLRSLPFTNGHLQTYGRGLRATCLAVFDRPEDIRVLMADADALMGTTLGGAYTYNRPYVRPGARGLFAGNPEDHNWDNSNSQYGLLGVWSAADADNRVEVPREYWAAVAKHWTDCQLPDGQWGYGAAQAGRLSMTSAGIASLFVAHEYLDQGSGGSVSVGRDPFPPPLAKGLAWYERGNNALRVTEGNWWGYQLYGIERVGLASGFKHFGHNDWYRELGRRVIERQNPDGSWGDGTIDTSYALLFLARGRHPVLMNKLRFGVDDDGDEVVERTAAELAAAKAGGYWANRPRDLANLARFATRQLERPINWQVVNADNPWTDWTDSPIVYVASHQPPALTEEAEQRLKRFVEAGGMLVTHADAGSAAFDKWARGLAAKLFPQYPMAPVPDAHPIWTAAFRVAARPPLAGVNNGSRLLWVHLPADVAMRWQKVDEIRRFEGRGVAAPVATTPQAEEATARALAPFHLGVNLYLYAAGKQNLRNRLDAAWVEPPAAPPIATVGVARLRYAGNWDPEPGAWVRYANWFQRLTSVKLAVEPIALADLSAKSVARFPIAHLTGTGNPLGGAAKVNFSDAEVAGLRAYVEAGGLVVADATGGMNAFATDVRESLLPRAWPTALPRLVDAGHPVLSAGAPGMEDLPKLRVRPYTFERFGSGVGTVQWVSPPDGPTTLPATGPTTSPATTAATGPATELGTPPHPQGGVLLTSLDLTTGLLGVHTWGVHGFEPKDAQTLMKNAIFWAVDGMPAK